VGARRASPSARFYQSLKDFGRWRASHRRPWLTVINWIDGYDHSGSSRLGTPAIFGMNFQTAPLVAFNVDDDGRGRVGRQPRRVEGGNDRLVGNPGQADGVCGDWPCFAERMMAVRSSRCRSLIASTMAATLVLM
jgi:hypothetical protein